jgi:heme exporter protein C
MKGLIIGLGVLLGIFLGLFPSIKNPKPLWWKVVVVVLLFFTIFLTFVPYVGSNFRTFKFVAQNITDFSGPLYFVPKSSELVNSDGRTLLPIVSPQNPSIVDTLIIEKAEVPLEFKQSNRIIANVKYSRELDKFVYLNTVSINPLLVLPYVPQLGEQIRIMNFHVPCAWVSVVAYLFAMYFSIRFLKNKRFEDDELAYSSAVLGTYFAILATVTGMIWAKINWGSFWNWDPRQTSIFVLLLIYFAYFVLRQSLDNHEIKARLSSVYSIVAFITVPFLVFVMPRLLEGNHPGSANSPNAGPILSTQGDTLNILQSLGFSLGFASLTALFFWFINLRIRIINLKNALRS